MLGRRQQPQRLPRAQPGHVCRRHHDEDTEAEVGELLPRGRGRALSARRPRGRVGGGRDVRHRHLDAQGAAHSGEAGDIQAVEGPGQHHSEGPRRRRGRAHGPRSGRCAHPVPVARRHLRQVPPRRPRGLHRRGHRDRLRRGRLAPRAGSVGGGHRVVRLVARVPAPHQGPRRPRRAARDLRCAQGPGQRRRGGVPGRLLAEMRRPT